jgi:peptide chain release factor subunit 1
VDGSGTLYGTLSGNTRAILHKFSVELPKKHGRGGQSSVRFARLRLEKRHNYLRKVAEGCTQHFINQSDSLPNVSGLILAGLADFKNDLNGSDLFDQRLKRIVLDVVDTSYGFENGFNQAIELSAEKLKDVIFIKEKKLVSRFFDQIAQDTGRYCFGIRDCLYACEAGAVETLIVFENLDTERFVLQAPEGQKIVYMNQQQAEKQDNFKDPKTGQDYEVVERVSLVEWIAENYKKFGCSLSFVTDRSQEGMQFVKGFGGIGSLLRYKLDFNTLDEEEKKEEDEEYDFFY